MSRQTRLTYPSDLTAVQWDRLQVHLPNAKGGRTAKRRKHPLRELVNAMLCQHRRFLPHHFPPWASVYNQFRTWRDEGVIEWVQLSLREDVRRQQGGKPLLPPLLWTARASRQEKPEPYTGAA